MFSRQLAERAAENNPIRVGIIGAGLVAWDENLLPLGLSDGIKLKCDVSQGEAISHDMVELDENAFVLKLRRLQDATV